MPSRLPMPPEVAEVYFDFDWDKRAVWALDIEPEIIDRELLDWHLDLPFWSSRPPEPLFDLVPRRVIENPSIHPVHARRLEQADPAVPLSVMEHRERLCIMDGLHRLAKAVLEKREQVVVRRVPREAIPHIQMPTGPAAPKPPDVDAVAERLRSDLGLNVDRSDLAFERGEGRWMAVLPEVVVLVADSDEGWKQLGREAALMAAARDVVGPQVPPIFAEDAKTCTQIRGCMSGLLGHDIEARIFGVPRDPPLTAELRHSELCPLTPWGERFARDLGRVFARFHRAMTAAEGRAAGFVPHRTNWDKVERVLHERPDLGHLLRAVPAARAWDESQAVEEVVIHGDPHLYNIFASEHGRVSGLIDFGDAAVGGRHEDLRYLHSNGPQFVRLATNAYMDESGLTIEPEIVARHHVRSAFEHFVWWELWKPVRATEIIDWTTTALKVLAPEWGR